MSSDYKTPSYIHGYDSVEQQRLVEQANYWQSLICQDLSLQANDTLLEIGCGVGAVLGVLGQAFPDVHWAGIDLQPRQIAYAQAYLATLGLQQVDLRVGDAQQLPWGAHQFDHVFAMWFLEHLTQPLPILREGHRVLNIGGRFTAIETDYSSLSTWPVDENFVYLVTGLCDLFLQSGGNPFMGRRLGHLLRDGGFSAVDNQPFTYHYFQTSGNDKLSQFIAYIDAWLAPTLPQIQKTLGREQRRLQAGLDFFRQLPEHPEGAVTITVYRATATKGSEGQLPENS